MAKDDKSKLEELNKIKSPLNKKETNDNELLEFFLGIVLLGVGLFMLSKRVMVHGSWYIWSFGGINLSSGTIIIPLIIGIIWYFVNSKSIMPKIIILLSVIFIIVTIIMSVRINLVTMSLFDYILIFGMMAAGAGLLLKTLFTNKKE